MKLFWLYTLPELTIQPMNNRNILVFYKLRINRVEVQLKFIYETIF